ANRRERRARLAAHAGKNQASRRTSLSAKQTKAIEEFRGDMVQPRRQLRDVQAALLSDIERLKNWLKFFNIALIPIVVALTAVVLGLLRLRRRHRRTAET